MVLTNVLSFDSEMEVGVAIVLVELVELVELVFDVVDVDESIDEVESVDEVSKTAAELEVFVAADDELPEFD